MIIDGNVLTADDGKKLTDGKGTYSNQVYLGIHDKPDNWYEVDNDEPEETGGKEATSEDFAEALIELGVRL